MIKPFKERKLRRDEPIWVYRNLSYPQDGVWYSIMQRGLVIGHTQIVDLRKCTFKVRESGRQKVIRTGVKNVHAYVVGTIADREPAWHTHYEKLSGRYNPLRAGTFEVVEPEDGTWIPMGKARAAHLGPQGLMVWGTDP